MLKRTCQARDPWEHLNSRHALTEMLGDPSSPLWSECYQVVSQLVYSKMPMATDAEDIIQESMLAICKGVKKFRQESRLTTWIATIVIRTIWRLRNSEECRTWLKIGSLPPGDDEGEAPWATFITQDSAERIAELREQLREALDTVASYCASRLPERLRRDAQIIHLMFCDDREIGKISDKLNMNKNSVRRVIHEARKRLRSVTEDYETGVYRAAGDQR